MLDVDTVEELLRGDPNVMVMMIGQALTTDADAMPKLVALLDHERTCGCQTESANLGARLAEAINGHIRDHARRSVNLAATIAMLSAPDEEGCEAEQRH